jgi:hypothetical protein
MIQLNKSAEDQLVAFYPEVTPSASIDAVRFNYNQDYDRSSGSFDGAVLSKKQWVVASVSGSVVPANTGQYTLDIYELTAGADLVWNTADVVWNLADTTWEDATVETVGQLLATERAYISGSNENSLTTYYSPNQNGSYITYNS